MNAITRSTVAVFGSTDSPHTMAALQSFSRQLGVDLIFHDIREEPKALQAMLKATEGRTEIPVIIKDGKLSVGFGGKERALIQH